MLSKEILSARGEELQQETEEDLTDLTRELADERPVSYYVTVASRREIVSKLPRREFCWYKLMLLGDTFRIEGIWLAYLSGEGVIEGKMDPVDILSDGTIFSQGLRFSSQDVRVKALMNDLNSAEEGDPEKYEELNAELADNKSLS